jgi:hypothetical protein
MCSGGGRSLGEDVDRENSNRYRPRHLLVLTDGQTVWTRTTVVCVLISHSIFLNYLKSLTGCLYGILITIF